MDDSSMFNLGVKHGGSTISLELPESASVSDLMAQVEAQTNVFVRHQKLIYRGRTLEPGQKLRDCKVTTGAKIMLLVAQGGAGSAPTKGQQVAADAKKQKQEEASARVHAAFAAVRAGVPLPPSSSHQHHAAPLASVPVSWGERRGVWQKTGVIGLRGMGLAQLPDDVFTGGQGGGGGSTGSGGSGAQEAGRGAGGSSEAEAGTEPGVSTGTAPGAAPSTEPSASAGPLSLARAADLSHNTLTRLPASVSNLSSLVSLRLGRNALVDDGMPWGAVGGLRALQVLEMDDNQLTQVPGSTLSCLTSLRRLSVCGNRLGSLPDGGVLGCLVHLEVLRLDGNRLEVLPDAFGGCSSLVELSAAHNQLACVPETLGRLASLQCLRLGTNRIATLPADVLQGCTSLWALQLDNNPITLEVLRATPGFGAYDERRKAKCDKQLDGGAMMNISKAFYEGADQELWQHWNPGEQRPRR
ncbi:hypothetical protein FOA52_004238 [Chlamydomonas sp. UWO 241]|nr:hypothetical protein FOA52_004238 [Chlamydomonas sp. UWO 241]